MFSKNTITSLSLALLLATPCAQGAITINGKNINDVVKPGQVYTWENKANDAGLVMFFNEQLPCSPESFGNKGIAALSKLPQIQAKELIITHQSVPNELLSMVESCRKHIISTQKNVNNPIPQEKIVDLSYVRLDSFYQARKSFLAHHSNDAVYRTIKKGEVDISLKDILWTGGILIQAPSITLKSGMFWMDGILLHGKTLTLIITDKTSVFKKIIFTLPDHCTVIGGMINRYGENDYLLNLFIQATKVEIEFNDCAFTA